MEIKVELWQLVTALGGFLAAAATLFGLFLNHFTGRINESLALAEKTRAEQHAQLEKRLDGIEGTHREDTAQWSRVERELMALKADLPVHYVRREDYVQAVAQIMVKLDAMSLRFENILLRGERREPR